MLRNLTPPDAPELLVGAATGDDAAVWRITTDRALVVTADFITPVVDDAATWGRVAAANAVSDIYAMGARPLLALNLVCWNREELSIDLLSQVLAGGQEVARAGGFVVAGGHTVDDPEPKYGMAVIGEVNPERLLTNAGLNDNDLLVLTKPIGTGVITTALKQGSASQEVVASAIAGMTRLNDIAARVALDHGARGATDITGFGLLGHGARLAAESGMDLELWPEAVPIIPGARELAAAGAVPGGTARNLAWVRPLLDGDMAGGETEDELTLTLLADAQTSGGLLFGVAEQRADAALVELRSQGHNAAVIGRARSGEGRIRLGR